MRTLIKNAVCVFPEGSRLAAVLIEGKKIAAIDPVNPENVDQTIDATGLHLIPGAIDDQVHFRDPGLTHKEDLHTGSLACAKGGITTFFEMPNTNPPAVTVTELQKKYQLGSEKSVVNYAFYIGATPDNVEELQKAEQSPDVHTPGIKIFIGSSTGNLLVDEQAALERIFAETTLPICAHCEDETTVRNNAAKLDGGSSFNDHSLIRDVEAAVIATKRAINLAKKHNHRFHVLHVSTGAELEFIRDHEGLISAEICPHHLLFNTDDYERLGSLVQMNPSIKAPENNEQLWNALLDGTVQVIATDHAPHTREEKDQPYPKSPSGLPAVENSLALMLDRVNQGLCTIEQVVHWMCEAPARVWDLMNKGVIKEGFDADLVLVDMNREETILNDNQLTKCGWSPWHGTTLKGWPIKTWVGGNLVYTDGKVDETHRGESAQFDHSRGGYWNHTL